MEIIQVTTITLEDEEINALNVLKLAHDECMCRISFVCDECPLYLNERCLGACAEIVLERQKERSKKV